MHESRTGARTRRAAAALAITATALGLFVTVPAALAAKPKPPPNPSNGQISSAQAEKQRLADQVGTLSSQVAEKKQELLQLQGRAELAEQKYALAVSKVQIAQHQLKVAQAAATRARAQVVAAHRTVTIAHDNFVRYVQATYMAGGTEDTTAGSLLTATDPSALLEQGTLEQYQSEHQINAIGKLQLATVQESNAEAAARKAVQVQADATKRAQDAADAAARAKQDAEDAVTAAQEQRAALEASVISTEQALNSARSHLATLNHERTKYDAYKRHQAALRRARIAAARAARAAARREARRRARLAAQHHHTDGGGTVITGPSAPVGGGWTAAKGQQAASRALSQLGTPYAWAGGGVYGPSRGVCDPSNGAPNDCYVTGYDCSGLAMYAWGKGWAHYAATQYLTAGHYHPSAGNLLPGDLIFWSFGGIWAIHHVAIYIGNGQIVEAPYSGGYVQTASLYEYGGFYGATRPLT